MWGFDAAYSFGYYEDELRELVHVFKYQKVYTLAKPLAKRMLAAVPRDLVFDVIVPVPMHWRKRIARGFNQAELLAEELSRSLHIPLKSALRRTRSSPAQVSMTSAQRRASLRKGSFAASKADAAAGRRVLLVDDVFTTGATARACARELKRAGASHVTLLTLARVDRRPVAMPRHARTTAATTGGN